MRGGMALESRVDLEQRGVRREEAVDELVAQRTESLEREKERAELANQAKSNFIASLNHELRNPLQTILGYADLLQEGGAEAGLSPQTLAGLTEIGKGKVCFFQFGLC